jgi:hypothetical protein
MIVAQRNIFKAGRVNPNAPLFDFAHHRRIGDNYSPHL